MAEKKQLHLIGLAPDRQWLAPAALQLIEEADVLAGADRLLGLFQRPGRKLPLTCPLQPWLRELKRLQEEGLKVVVLTSGDPNYFGLARSLLEVIDKTWVTIIPSTTIVQEAFARLRVSWQRTEVVSLHGRDGMTGLWSALYRAGHFFSGSGYLAVYTDPENTPSVIAKRLLGRGQKNWRMLVFEDLGSRDERLTSWSLFEAKLRLFSPLNLVVLECLKRPEPISLGMPESVYVHEAGLITKREIRVVTLGLLELQPFHTFWDLGAGSGSISIEAAALLPHGSIWAVEKSPLRSGQIAANRAYFGATQVEIIEDEALSAIDHLPAPDRVFIGGGGHQIDEIIKAARARLKPGGFMAANVVSFESLHLAAAAMTEAGLTLSITQIQADRSEILAGTGNLYLKPLNQVWIVRGELH
ncbi:MAG: precorrin-6y C5,15-methyltransferase (decarboxylating) subunit CbiE [Candidatus Adiutrix sp.]|jgi:precorrin-6Y C5,15-methyltransferase (decarboxylating)|nr:precorrin-6y C5,15-methyltransferase (decarboxylating) subunit CbiE [Candidatus Adiutrix sp.]